MSNFIDKRVSEENISELFEEANIIQYNQNINCIKRRRHLKKSQDLGILPSEDFTIVEDYSSPEEEYN